MAINKTAVFLASRFEEFRELRELLKSKITDWPGKLLTAIDLNDGNVSHRPPLAECLGYLRRAEFMILLLGETYGGFAPQSDKSFTHLEYEEAIREGSNTRVLVFCIGESYRNRMISYSANLQMAAWQRQVENNHTIGYLDHDSSLEELAQEIFDSLLSALYDMHFGALSVEVENSEDYSDNSIADSGIDETELSSMEVREAQGRGVSLVTDSEKFATLLDAITKPEAVAAFEQKEEAQLAINAHEYGIAIQHLKRALNHRPLDLLANYWLAQLYLIRGSKQSCSEAIDFAERAARIAELEGGKIRAAGAYMIAARAAHLSNREAGGLHYARKAAELAPHYSKVHIELARHYVLSGNLESALEEVEEAIHQYPRSVRDLMGDPVFKPVRKNIHQVINSIKDQVAKEIFQLYESEQILCKALSVDVPNVQIDKQLSLLKLYEIGRSIVRRQLKLVSEAIATASEITIESELGYVEATTEVTKIFKLGDSRSIRIEAWMKQTGDVANPGDELFSFCYLGSTAVRKWLWTGKESIRITEKFKELGSLVSDDSPELFQYRPSDYQEKPLSKVQELNEKISFQKELIEKAKLTREAAIGEVMGAMVAAKILTSSKGLGQWADNNPKFAPDKYVLAEAGSVIEEANREIEIAKSELELHMSKCIESQSNAKYLLGEFERRCLAKVSWMLPIASPFSCRVSDLIRIKESQLETLKLKINREIEVVDELPNWLIYSSQGKQIYGLYRVVSLDAQKLSLSRYKAYFS